MDTAWKQCLIDYLRSLRSPETRTSYANVLLRFFALHPDPCAVTRRDIESFMRTHFPDPHRKGEQGELAVATMNQRVAAIASFFRYASSWIPENETEPLWRKANPASGIVRNRPERSPKGLSLDELHRLFAVIPRHTLVGIRDHAALSLTYWTARRRSEISHLLYGDIIETSFPDGHGGMRQAHALAFRGKGHRETRDLQEIPHHAMESITWYLLASGRNEMIKPEDPLFTSTMPGKEKPLSGSTLAKRIRYYGELAGLSVSLHVLRHTAARTRHAAGASIQEVQQLLRHSNIGTTDIYLRTLVGVEDRSAHLLESQLSDL